MLGVIELFYLFSKENTVPIYFPLVFYIRITAYMTSIADLVLPVDNMKIKDDLAIQSSSSI